MTTAGEAATLFGPTDSASDPFALASGDSDPDTRNFASGDDLSAGNAPPAAADLFGSSVDQSAYFSDIPSDTPPAYGHNDSSWSTGARQGAAAYGNSVAPVANEGYDRYGSQTVAKEWSGQQQWEPQSYQPQANGIYNAYSQTVSSQQYNQYSPYNPLTPSAAQESSHIPSYGAYSASAYPTSAAQTVTSQSVYDPYKPSREAAPTQSAPVQGYSTPTTVLVPQVPTVEPPEPTRATTPAAAYRPKTTNAYDPPLPPPKPAPRRASAWHAPHSLSQYEQTGNPAVPYGMTQPGTLPSRVGAASLPPPPRTSSASVPPPPPRGSSAMRQFASPPPPLPSAPHLQHGTQQPIDPYASPPRPAPTHLNGMYTAPPAQAPNHGHQIQNYSGVHKDTYARTSRWPPSVQSPPTQYSELSHEVSRTDVADDIGRVYGSPYVHKEAAELPSDRPSHDVADVSWNPVPVGPPPSTVTNADSIHSVGPVHSTVVEDAEGVWNTAVADSVHQDHSWAQHERVPSVPISPRTQASQRLSSPVSSKGSSSSPTAAYDPYKPNGVAAQSPRARAISPERTRSPGSSSVKSRSSLKRTSLEHSRISQRPPSVASQSIPATRAYESPPAALQQADLTQRTASPSSSSVHSVQSAHSTRSVGSVPRRDSAPSDPYAPVSNATGSSSIRGRSTSNGSVYAGVAEDPYAPSRHPRQPTYEAPSYGSFSALPPPVGYSPVVPPPVLAAAQVALVPPTVTQYAPSPSLLGTNDPLGRTSARVPVVSFGFGGKLVTCFHNTSILNTGFDVAISSRAATDIYIRPLYNVIPQSALDTSAASYPGPLYSDPGTPTTTLVRTGAAAQTKTKKARVIKYLEERGEEISHGLGYVHPGSMEGCRVQAKWVLIKLLKVIVENDGRLSGSTQIDAAVRAALLPNLEMSADQSVETFRTPALGFSHPSDISSHYSDANDHTISVHTLRTSHLEKIQQMLLRGDRRGAYQYAADEKLWAHAMVIASSIDREAWKEVVNEFVRTELAGKESVQSKSAGLTADAKGVATGRESLRVAYSLFAGQGAAAVQELLPPQPLTSLAQLHPAPPTAPAVTPMSASFPSSFQTSVLPAEILAKWTETAAMMISSPITPEVSSALTALGDQLAANGWVEAAHVCYLLSPQTSPIGGVGAPSVRVSLYGAPSPHVKPNFWKDPDPIIFSEIVEFALSLATPAKGQEAYSGLPHLQPYKLIRAATLAELGHVQIANRYCEAISNTLTRPSPYLNATFIEQLRRLTDRLVAAPVVDKSGSWIASKMTKPSLDKISNWLEGRFTSLITGEDESPKHEEAHAKGPSFSGPFAHYSTISSSTSSTAPSPQMSTTNLNGIHSASVPTRTGSAMALQFASGANAQIARASSAIDYLRRKPSPVQRISSASAASFNDVPSPSGSQPYLANGYAPIPEATPKAERGSKLSEMRLEEEPVTESPAGPRMGSWWGASEDGVPTPTASSFDHSDSGNPSSEGFISLMDAPTFTPSTSVSRTSSSQQYDDEGDDELGLGNNHFKKNNVEEPNQTEVAQGNAHDNAELDKAGPTQEAEKPASSGWFTRLWKRNDSSSPAPVKANLGKESSFYYDKELKRWINKNAPPEAAKAAQPPPPPRAQTASPGSHGPKASPHVPSPGPPPARPATAVDLMHGPPRKPPVRVRSNLVPSESSSAPPTPSSVGSPPPATGPPRPSTAMDPPLLDGPPAAGARTRNVKRNARSRYVDVFQQDTTGN